MEDPVKSAARRKYRIAWVEALSEHAPGRFMGPALDQFTGLVNELADEGYVPLGPPQAVGGA